jgi:hypothetical protein
MATWVFYLAAFTSAFLLFLIQPMLSKALLPAFGGSYLVWGSAMVFFQAVLLAGYVFGHAAQCRLGTERYARWHWLMLLMPFLFFPFHFDTAGHASSLPLAPAVFVRLLAMVGGPFLTLSMTSLILQRWLMISPLKARSNPYVLYSASNAGSVLALLVYPSLIEPFLGLEAQARLWWAGYALLVVLHAACYPRHPVAAQEGGDTGSTVTWRQRRGWFLLSMGACATLLAVTNVMTFDVASVPLLWALPLAIYLLAFVLAFQPRMWFPPWMETGLNWAALAAALLFLMMQLHITIPPAPAVFLHLSILFVLCMNSSARLVRTRPVGGEQLTGFYVILAAGGLCGSILVSWVIPLLSRTLVEYVLAVALSLLAAGLADGQPVCRRWRKTALQAAVCAALLLAVPAIAALTPAARLLPANVLFAAVALPTALLLRYAARQPLLAALLLAMLAAGASPLQQVAAGGRSVISLRNYYGIYNVFDRDGLRYLQHGTTLHGRQYTAEERRAEPLGYYHATTPAAGLLSAWGPRLRDIGMVGLGTGALAAYAGNGQHFTVYELDPDNLAIAERFFTYLDQSRRQGTVLDFVFGDGRISLRNQKARSLDLLIIDAFNSGSIPAHLITVEALDEYFRVLRDDGLLLLHISNKVLDLAPVIYASAAATGTYACEQSNEGRLVPDAEVTSWMALSRHQDTITALKRELFWFGQDNRKTGDVKPWTDRYSNILGAVRWLR